MHSLRVQIIFPVTLWKFELIRSYQMYDACVYGLHEFHDIDGSRVGIIFE